jgi:hypothetical protein
VLRQHREDQLVERVVSARGQQVAETLAEPALDRPAMVSGRRDLARGVAELRERRFEVEPDGIGWPISVLRDDQFRLTLLLRIGVVAMYERDDIAILLDRSAVV